VPFSLGQVHVTEGEAPIWDRPEDDTGLLALQAGVVVRDQFPTRFLAAHRALFRARHVDGLAIRDREVSAGSPGRFAEGLTDIAGAGEVALAFRIGYPTRGQLPSLRRAPVIEKS